MTNLIPLPALSPLSVSNKVLFSSLVTHNIKPHKLYFASDTIPVINMVYNLRQLNEMFPLTHLPLYKMVTISQTAFSNAFQSSIDDENVTEVCS